LNSLYENTVKLPNGLALPASAGIGGESQQTLTKQIATPGEPQEQDTNQHPKPKLPFFIVR
jgi:hypothetical protein